MKSNWRRKAAAKRSKCLSMGEGVQFQDQVMSNLGENPEKGSYAK